MTTREERLAQTFVELADTLVEDFDVVELLAVLSDRSVELFDAAAAGVLLADTHRRLRLMTATSEAMELVELFQLQNEEGPCLDCFRSGAPVLVEDLAAAAGRWPRFVPVATQAGFRSAQALPLRLRGEVLGAFGLFRHAAGSMGPADAASAQALADVATLAILQHRAVHDAQLLADQLQLALNSRVAIEQAKGIIAEHAGVGMEEAFSRLRGYARAHHLRLSDAAESLVAHRISVRQVMA